jgi:hypothetical protein
MDERRRFYYRAYLLRLWCEEPVARNVPAQWRASLRAVDGDACGETRIGFASLDELCIYLQEQLNRTKHPNNTD